MQASRAPKSSSLLSSLFHVPPLPNHTLLFLKKLLRRRTTCSQTQSDTQIAKDSPSTDSSYSWHSHLPCCFLLTHLASSRLLQGLCAVKLAILPPPRVHPPRPQPVSRLVATAAASADLASLETATLSKLRLARHHVRKAWICWASKPSAHPPPLVPTVWGSPIILALHRTLSRLLAAIGESISATRRASTQHPTSWQPIWNSPDHYICAQITLRRMKEHSQV